MKLGKLQSQIVYLVAHDPRVVSNYALLCLTYWGKYEAKLSVMRLTSPEAITRAFRLLVEKGLIKIPLETYRARQNEKAEIEEYIANARRIQ